VASRSSGVNFTKNYTLLYLYYTIPIPSLKSMIKVDGNILHYVVGYCGRQEQLQLLVASLIQPLVFMCLPTQVLINKVIIVKCIVFITLLQSLCNYAQQWNMWIFSSAAACIQWSYGIGDSSSMSGCLCVVRLFSDRCSYRFSPILAKLDLCAGRAHKTWTDFQILLFKIWHIL